MSTRDLSHWAEWSDGELVDQAAGACQHPALIDDDIVREAIALNVIAPFRQAMKKQADKCAAQEEEIARLKGRLSTMSTLHREAEDELEITTDERGAATYELDRLREALQDAAALKEPPR